MFFEITEWWLFKRDEINPESRRFERGDERRCRGEEKRI